MDKPDLERPRAAWREGLRVFTPVAIAVTIVIAVSLCLLEPGPPQRVVIATGPEGSTYNTYAAGYVGYFAEHGIELVIQPTGGATENYKLLLDLDSGVDLAIVQGGTAPPADQAEPLAAVCSVALEPLFVVYRTGPTDPELSRLSELAGKRVAIGSLTGGTRRVSVPLLSLHGLGPDAAPAEPPTTYVDQSGAPSAKLLKAGEVDAGFYAIDVQTPYLVDLLTTPGMRVMDFDHAEAYLARFDYLALVTLHEGMIDVQRNIPERDVQLVAPVTALVARKSTHDAVIQLLIQAAQRVHGRGHPMAPAGTFPSLNHTELPIGDTARHFYSTRPSFLQRKLPFWLASLLDRLLIVVVPLVVILIPVVRFAPAIYRWRVRSRIYRWYKRLRFLDARLLTASTPSQIALDRKEAEELEREIAYQKVPLGYMEELYNLRLHLAYLRDRLAGDTRAGLGPPAPLKDPGPNKPQ